MDPLAWLREQWARISSLPTRLQEVANGAHAILSDSSQPRALRDRAGRVWSGAIADRAEVDRLLRDNIRAQQEGMRGLAAFPVIFVVGAISAAAIVAKLADIFGRASTYERELALLEAGTVTVSDMERLRDNAPDAPGGVAATIRETGKVVKLALVGVAGFAAYKLWGKRGR